MPRPPSRSGAPTPDFVHRFEPGTAAGPPPLLLLHGTGGDETDLLPLGRAVSPGSALLSPRGKVLENGMPRFFRRFAEGLFDEADLRARAGELVDFVGGARERYGLPAPVALGYSNGANIAAAVLLLFPDVFAGAALLRAMMPFEPSEAPDLSGKPVLILSGAADPILPAENARRLAALLRQAGADTRHEILAAGHGLSPDDVSITQGWIASLTL